MTKFRAGLALEFVTRTETQLPPPVGVFVAGHLGVSQGMTPSAFWLSIGDKSKSGGVLEVEIHAWERVWPKSNNIRIIFKEEYQ